MYMWVCMYMILYKQQTLAQEVNYFNILSSLCKTIRLVCSSYKQRPAHYLQTSGVYFNNTDIVGTCR